MNQVKPLDYVDWIDHEGWLNAFEEQLDRWRRFKDNSPAREYVAPTACLGQGCALTLTIFGKDVSINDRDYMLWIAYQEVGNCEHMEWRGRPLTNMEMHLLTHVLREKNLIQTWWEEFQDFLRGLNDVERADEKGTGDAGTAQGVAGGAA